MDPVPDPLLLRKSGSAGNRLITPMQDKLIQVTNHYEKVNVLFGVVWKLKNKKTVLINLHRNKLCAVL